MTVKYMHTINGEPAYYRPGEQIVFRPSKRYAIPLVGSLEEITRDQEASRAYRKRNGYGLGVVVYGHLRVETGG
jgi:hypothetical protein